MADFYFSNHGTICILTANSAEARDWRKDNLPEDAVTWGRDGVVIEPRYAEPILDGIAEAGLTVGVA